MSARTSKTVRLRLNDKKIRLKLSHDSTADWEGNFNKICARILDSFQLAVNKTCIISADDTKISDAEQLKEILVKSPKKLIDISVTVQQEKARFTLTVNLKETECKENELIIKLNDLSTNTAQCWNNIMNPIILKLDIESIDTFFDKYLLLTQDHGEPIEELDDIIDYFEDTDTLHLIVKVKCFFVCCLRLLVTPCFVVTCHNRRVVVFLLSFFYFIVVKRAGGQKKMFMIGFKDHSISWHPNTITNNTSLSWNEHFNDLSQKLNKQTDVKTFDVEMPILFDVNHENNKSLMCNNKNDSIAKHCNILNSHTIKYFWNLLCASRDISVMNFMIGLNGISSKRAIIISPQSLNGVNKCLINYFVFDFYKSHASRMKKIDNDKKEDDGNDAYVVPDWDGYFEKLVLFLNVVTNNSNNKSRDLLYSIHAINKQQVVNVSTTMKISELKNLFFGDDKVRVNCQVENSDDFKKCFVAGDNSSNISGDAPHECYLFVENKHYFILKMDNIEFEWHPQQQEDENNWDNEYSNLLTFVCDKFDLVNDKNLHLKFLENDDEHDESEITNGDDIEMMWDEIVNDNKQCVNIIVNGSVSSLDESGVEEKEAELQTTNAKNSGVDGAQLLKDISVGFVERVRRAIEEENFIDIEIADTELKKVVGDGYRNIVKMNSYKNCQTLFCRKVHSMIADLNFTISELQKTNWQQSIRRDEIKKLADSFYSMRGTISIGSILLTEKQNIQLIKFQNKSQRLLEGWIDGSLSHLTQLIESHEFVDAESRISDFLVVWPIMGSLTSPEYEKRMDEKEELDLSTWENKIRNHCQKVIEEYKKLELNKRGYLNEQYSLKKLNDQLKDVLKRRACYRLLKHETWQDFQEKFEAALNEAEKSEDAKKILSLCRYAIDFAPTTKQDGLKELLDHRKHDIDQNAELFDNKFANFEKSGDFAALAKMLEQAENDGERVHANRIIRRVRSEVSRKRSETRNALDSCDWESYDSNSFKQIQKVVENHNGICDIVKKFEKELGQAGTADNFIQELQTILEGEEKIIVAKFVQMRCDVDNDHDSQKEHIRMTSGWSQILEILDMILNVLYLDKYAKKINSKMEELSQSLTKHLDTWEKELMQMTNDHNNSCSVNFKRIESILMEFEFWQNNDKFCGSDRYKNGIETVIDTLSMIRDNILKQEFTTKHRRINKERQDLMASIKIALNQLINCHKNHDKSLCQKYLDFDVYTKCLEPIFDSFCSHICGACTEIEREMKNERKLDQASLDLVNDRSDICSLFSKDLLPLVRVHGRRKDQVQKIVESVQKCEAHIIDVVRAKEEICHDRIKHKSSDSIHNFAMSLMELEMAARLLTKVKYHNVIDKMVPQCLEKYAKTNPRHVAQLGITIENEWKPEWSGQFLAKHGIFAAQSISRFRRATHAQGIDYIERNIKCEPHEGGQQLTKLYQEFEKQYRILITQHLKFNLNCDNLSASCKNLARDLHQKVSKVDAPIFGIFGGTKPKYNWDSKLKQKAIGLMAHVFAIWTLLNSQHYFYAESNNLEDPNSYLMQPRAAQVVSIFRMLSIDNKEHEFVRHLVQIGTGEGKSLTLAVTSCMMALMGFNVSCACYSKYLSRRDFNSFENLFETLNVKKYIHYGTFDELCERTINSDGCIRELLENAILHQHSDIHMTESKKNQVTTNNKKRWKVLLIDEVDVFFSDSFYGKEYTPAAMLRDPVISDLTDFIWQSSQKCDFGEDKYILYQRVVNSQQFKNCAQLLGRLAKRVLIESVKQMVFDVATFKTQEYEIRNDKIGYRRLDGVDYGSLIGYKTMWAYYHEYHSNHNISKQTFNKNKYICLSCGMFSYSQIAKDQFDIIMGVSGTLETLSTREKEIMKDEYGIKRFTYMPPLFGKNKFRFDKTKDVIICEESNYYENLKEEIKNKMDHIDGKRCVFVFFDTKQKLDDFYECKQFSEMKQELRHQDKLFILGEELDENEKRVCVARSCTSGSLLLSTKSFGRGTDFQIADKIVKSNGGPHVISAFLSVEISEEKQIMGRTARQGGEGSFSMVLNENELEMFQVHKTELNDIVNNRRSELYLFLNAKRLSKFRRMVDAMAHSAEIAAKNHTEASQLLHFILSNSVTYGMADLLRKFNEGPSMNESTKVVVLMDATGSMAKLLSSAKNTVQEMFKRISAILEEKNKDAKSFQLQFVTYKNYNAPSELLLQHSGWCCDSTQLKTFLDGVEARYGWENEAMEVAFEYVNDLINQEVDKIDQIIVIGDMPPNEKDKIKEKREKKGEEYWQKTRFKNPTYWKDELKLIADNKIKVNAFYLKGEAKDIFSTIAEITGGVCGKLDIDSNQGAETLTNLVSQRVLDAAGGIALVEAYKGKYMHGDMR